MRPTGRCLSLSFLLVVFVGCGSVEEAASPELSAIDSRPVPASAQIEATPAPETPALETISNASAGGTAVRAPRSMTADELEEELEAEKAGRFFRYVLRAHGGWDAWRRVRGVSFQVERVCHTDSDVASVVEEDLAYPIPGTGDDGRSEPAADSLDLVDEPFYATAPFSLVDRRLDAEYVGVEMDTASGKSFVKIRFESLHGGSPEGGSGEGVFPCVAYFDKTTHLLERLLVTTSSGEFRLVVYSSWYRPGESEIRVAMERDWYFLRRRDAHFDFGQPSCEEKLRNVQLDLPRE